MFERGFDKSMVECCLVLALAEWLDMFVMTRSTAMWSLSKPDQNKRFLAKDQVLVKIYSGVYSALTPAISPVTVQAAFTNVSL